MVPRRRARKKHNARLNARLTHARTPAAGLAWSALCCIAWHGSITGTHQSTPIYIIIIGGCAALYSVRRGGGILVLVEVQNLTVCPPALRRRLVWLLYCVRWNGSNQQKRTCKAL